MQYFAQLRLLIWKNYIIRKRQKIRLCIEIIWPLVLFLILMWVRTRGLKRDVGECHYSAKALPSAGIVPFLSAFYCTFSNPCYSTVEDNNFTALTQQNSSAWLATFEEVQEILENNVRKKEISSFYQVEKDVHALRELADLMKSSRVFKHDLINLGSLFLGQPSSVFEENNLMFPADVDSMLMNSNLSLSHLVKVLYSADWSTMGEFFCNDSMYGSVLNFKQKSDLREFASTLCGLSTPQLTSVLVGFSKIMNGAAAFQQLSRLTKSNIGVALHPDDWITVTSTLSDIANLTVNSDSSKSLSESLNKNMLVALDSIRDNPEEFLSLVICRRNETTIDRRGNSTAGLTRLDEIGKRLNVNVQIFGSPEDNDTVAACGDLLSSFEKMNVLRFLWKQVKPFVRGKILYTPNTPAVERLMTKVNESFSVITDLLIITDQWLNNISPGLKEYLFNRSETLQFWQNITNPELVEQNQLLKGAWEFVLQQWSKSSAPNATNSVTLDELHSFFSNNTRENWEARITKIDSLVKIANSVLKCFDKNKFEPVATEEEGEIRGMELVSQDRLWALIVFENFPVGNGSVLPKHVRYKIRMDAGRVDSTKRVQDRFSTPGDRNNHLISLKYLTSGFAYLQDMIEQAIIGEQTGFAELPGMYVQQFPYPCYVYDQFILAISRTFPMFMVLAWVYSSAMIIKTVVHEKEKRLKEVMKVMGLGNEIHWIGWFINAFVIMLVTVSLLTLVLKYGNILTHSDPWIIFIFLTLYASATITLSFLVSVFFSRSNVAAATGGMIFFVLYMPYPFMVIWEEELVGYEKILVSLLSNVAFGFGCSYFAHYEESGFGLQWFNIRKSPILGDTYSMAGVMEMLAIDCVLYASLAWYIEIVFPGEFGIKKPWYFLCTPTYWCGKAKVVGVGVDQQEDSDMEMASVAGSNFEKEPTHLKLGVQIQNLKKIFDNKKVAINNLNLNFYEDQITSFLGHNGAGKTTTISILTGLFPQTSGSAKIYGSDISSNMDTIRKSLGMCPQFNVLFDHLTVEEHLVFYGCLKGWTKAKVMGEVDKMIVDIGLPHKRHAISRDLSGGMQRKLSVAIAFVGGSRTVILDEPTAGVDPFARRSIWDLLLKYKTSRTIILTTHHMDEADLLGDRIAIISRGRLRCCGSSMFLKRRYGEGYTLTLVTEEPSNGTTATTGKGAQGQEVDERKTELRHRITAAVLGHVAGAQFVEMVGMDLNYVLPNEAKEDGSFVRLFDALELRRAELGITSYGISECTLEEIFFKVAEEDSDSISKASRTTKGSKNCLKIRIPRTVATFLKLDGKGKVATVSAPTFHQQPFDDQLTNQNNLIENGHPNGPLLDNESKPKIRIAPEAPKQATYIPIQGWWLIRRQIIALHIKRFHHTRRNIKGLFCEIVLPAVFVCLALIFTLVLPPFRMEPPLVLNPWLYGPPNFVFFANDNPADPLAVQYEKTLVNHPSLGTRCMHSQPIWKKPCIVKAQQMQYKLNFSVPYDEVVPCSCDMGTQVCPANAGGPTPPSMISDTTDILMNMTSRNISDWLVKTEKQYYKQRYGGITFGINNPLAQINLPLVREIFDNISEAMNLGQPIMENTSYVFSEIDRAMRDLPIFSNIQIWFNNRGWAAMVAYINAVNNIVLRAHLPSHKDPDFYGITITSHPLNYTQEQTQTELIKRSGANLIHAICVIFAMSFVPASFVLYLIEDRVCKSQHLQFVTGVRPLVYWIATLIWDNLNYLVSALLCVIIFLMFNEQAYVSSTNLPGLILLLVLYGWASIPMMYPASFFFSIPSTAFVVLASGNLFVGVVTTVSTFILEVMDDEELQEIASILKKVFLIFPHYCLGRGLMDMATNNIASVVFEKYGIKIDRSPLAWDFLGRNLLCMFVQGIIFFSITMCIQYNVVSFIRNYLTGANTRTSAADEQEEGDVARERKHILNGEADNDILKIVNLTKVYNSAKNCCCCNKDKSGDHEDGGASDVGGGGRLVAVDRLCFGVKGGECFGLLGVNGAGKTTTFKMLTQDTSITSGDAFVNGHSIRTAMTEARYHIGYCPQFDALDSLLTGLEHLYFYGRLRGIPDSEIKRVADHHILKMNLVDYADRCAGTYSGGNKRKLSTAIALIGNPSLVFLDEPTTGMDPKARRFLWTCISELVRDGRSVILTSHSLEECEALCTRLAIMVNGRFSCIGSIQHLKNKYGSGYTLQVRIGDNLSKLENFKEFVRHTFPDAILLEEHHNQLVFQFPSQAVVLSTLFGQMESAKIEFHIEDYSICQTTLDQVFINFAKKQLHLQDG